MHVGEDGLCGTVLCGPGARDEIEINHEHDDMKPPWELEFYLSRDLTRGVLRSFYLHISI